jgi:predicted methyltransferase
MSWQQKPYTCPVCSGRGVVPKGYYDNPGGTVYESVASPDGTEVCRACNGTGIVWGNGYEYDPLPPIQPWIVPNPYYPYPSPYITYGGGTVQ